MVQAFASTHSGAQKADFTYTAGHAHLILLRACSSKLLTVVRFSCRLALSVLYLSLSLVIRSSCSNRRCLVSWSDCTAAFCSCCRSEQHRPFKRPAWKTTCETHRHGVQSMASQAAAPDKTCRITQATLRPA